MDLHTLLALGKEFLVLIVVFAALLTYAVMRGRRALISFILGLYIALLISIKFPYYAAIHDLAGGKGINDSISTIIVFTVFTLIGAFLFEKIISYEYGERPLESITKKVILAVLGTMLLMAYSYHVLPVTSIIDPGSAVSALFAPSQYFFWFLVTPLIGLFFV